MYFPIGLHSELTLQAKRHLIGFNQAGNRAGQQNKRKTDQRADLSPQSSKAQCGTNSKRDGLTIAELL